MLRQIHIYSPFESKTLVYICSRNGVVLSLWASVAAIIMYILFSLQGKKNKFNMDKLLYRGQYAIADDITVVTSEPIRGLRKLIGMGQDFNLRDKIVYLCTVGWTTAWFIGFIFVTAYNVVVDVKTESWIKFWEFYMWLSLIIGVVIAIWFTIGGIIDLKKMFCKLRDEIVNAGDDGRVLHEPVSSVGETEIEIKQVTD